MEVSGCVWEAPAPPPGDQYSPAPSAFYNPAEHPSHGELQEAQTPGPSTVQTS